MTDEIKESLKLKYIGKTTMPLALAIQTIPAVTNGKIYEIIFENKETNSYVFIDDLGIIKVLQKDYFKKVEW